MTQRPCIHDDDRYCAYNSVGCESNLYLGMVAGMQVAGYQCHGFALKVAQDLYGSLKKWKYVESYRTIHAGDVIRINNNSHTIIVTKVYSGQHSVCGLQFHRRLSDPVGQDHEQTGIEKSIYLHVHEILRQKNEPALK